MLSRSSSELDDRTSPAFGSKIFDKAKNSQRPDRQMSGYRRPTAWRLLCVLLLCLGSVPSLASNVRSTKSYDFKETDGSASGFIMFNLDKIHPSEVFKIESPNRWVSVDTTGAVRVKDPWDYEQLGKEKTIDFWVIITSPNLNGKFVGSAWLSF